jgi:hypothetical protein
MAAEKRKLSLSKETLRTLSATALSQVAGGACYASQYCADTTGGNCGGTRTYAYGTNQWICGPTDCQTLRDCYGGGGTSNGFSSCFTCTPATCQDPPTVYSHTCLGC